MTVDRVMPVEVAAYVGQTRQRINRVIQVLDNLRQGQAEDLNGVIRPLHEQKQASQEAGFAGIARLVHDMSDCLQWTAEVQRSLAAGTIAALLDACQCIVLHAEAVEAGVYRKGAYEQETTDEQTRLPLAAQASTHSRRPRTAACEEILPGEP